jgi:hypothetical protein
MPDRGPAVFRILGGSEADAVSEADRDHIARDLRNALLAES